MLYLGEECSLKAINTRGRMGGNSVCKHGSFSSYQEDPHLLLLTNSRGMKATPSLWQACRVFLHLSLKAWVIVCPEVSTGVEGWTRQDMAWRSTSSHCLTSAETTNNQVGLTTLQSMANSLLIPYIITEKNDPCGLRWHLQVYLSFGHC